jgi:hypothetical protein
MNIAEVVFETCLYAIHGQPGSLAGLLAMHRDAAVVN